MISRIGIVDPKKHRIMHEYFLGLINKSMNDKRYIEATWLIYAYIENRLTRTIGRYNYKCPIKDNLCKIDIKRLSISTKIKCIKGCYENNETMIRECFNNVEILEDVKRWVDKRNKLTHELIDLKYMGNYTEDFKKVAIEGHELLKTIYNSTNLFREKFEANSDSFIFPEDACKYCASKQKK